MYTIYLSIYTWRADKRLANKPQVDGKPELQPLCTVCSIYTWRADKSLANKAQVNLSYNQCALYLSIYLYLEGRYQAGR